MTKVLRIAGEDALRLQKSLKNLNSKVGKVGWFEKSKYPDGTPVAYVAAIQEFGSPKNNIPARPMLRSTIERQKNVWSQIAESEARKIIRDESTVEQGMQILGLKAAGDVIETITQLQSPPISESTYKARLQKAKKKTPAGLLRKPLVDTGLMLATLTNTVENE